VDKPSSMVSARIMEDVVPRLLMFLSAHDLFVKMGLNAKERTRQDWENLLANADPRFELESIITPPQSVLSIIQVIWGGE
jgi:hypothetical protein